MTRINGVHHLAINTADIKAQIEFFSDVLGAELVALFEMHGVEGAIHAFSRLHDHCSISFVQIPANSDIEPILGVTHAGTGAGPSAPGTTQHLAFNVDTFDELMAIRDRIRSRGVNVIGHIEHGMCQSIYFAGPEGLVLEVATSSQAMDANRWIDPEIAALAGIDADDLDRFKNPAAYSPGETPLAQPAYDPAKPHLAYPIDDYKKMLAVPDDVLTAAASYAEPPVS